MRILLLGANGQLGTDLRNVFAGDAMGRELVPWCRRDLDVSDLDAVARRLDSEPFEVLINTTSYHKTEEVERHATEAFRINAHAVTRMAQVCRRKRAFFFHISTDYVFDGEAARPYRETDNPGPLNIYGSSKLMGERLALLTHPDTTILRVASLFGQAGASGKGGNFVETMIRVGQEKKLLRVVRDITMSPTGTKEVARRILALLKAKAPAGIYHTVNSGQASWHDFAQEIISQTGINAEVLAVTTEEYPTEARRPRFSVLDNTKLSDVTGPIPPWRDALKEYLRDKGYCS